MEARQEKGQATVANTAPHVDVSHDVWNKTVVVPAYGKNGQMSHFVAWMPRDEFHRLYTPKALLAIFREGYCLQVMQGCYGKGVAQIDEKYTGAQVRITATNHLLGGIELQLSIQSRPLLKRRFAHNSLSEVLQCSDGLHVLSSMACKALHRYFAHSIVEMKTRTECPCVHVVPEHLKPTRFDRDLVQLQ